MIDALLRIRTELTDRLPEDPGVQASINALDKRIAFTDRVEQETLGLIRNARGYLNRTQDAEGFRLRIFMICARAEYLHTEYESGDQAADQQLQGWELPEEYASHIYNGTLPDF